MLFDQFRKKSKQHWNNQLKLIGENSVTVQPDGIPLFPSHIVFINFGDLFGMELLGAQKKPCSLIEKSLKYNSVDEYFNLFEVKTVNSPFLLAGGSEHPHIPHRMSNICISQGGVDSQIKCRTFEI